MTKYPVAKVADLSEHGKKIVTVNGMEFGIFLVGEDYYAWRNMCPHAYAPVCVGPMCGTHLPSNVYEYEFGRDQEIIRCPWHGWEFDLRTGQHLADTGLKLRGYPVERDGEELYLIMK